MSEGELYLGNVLSSFEAGVQLDLRVKMAMDFLKSPMFEGSRSVSELAATASESANLNARYALDLADSLLKHAGERGWVKPLPETSDISSAMRNHIGRSVEAAAHQAERSASAASRQGLPMGLARPGH